MWGEMVGGMMGGGSGSSNDMGAQQGGAILAGGYNAGISFGPTPQAAQQQSYMQLALIGGLVLVAFIALGKK